jgi:hypothetical protein
MTIQPKFKVERRSGGYYGITGDREITPSRATAVKWAALANAEERSARERRTMQTCKCGSVLSAVTFTCVRGQYCPR